MTDIPERWLVAAELTLLASGYTPNEDLVDCSEWSARQVADIALADVIPQVRDFAEWRGSVKTAERIAVAVEEFHATHPTAACTCIRAARIARADTSMVRRCFACDRDLDRDPWPHNGMPCGHCDEYTLGPTRMSHPHSMECDATRDLLAFIDDCLDALRDANQHPGRDIRVERRPDGAYDVCVTWDGGYSSADDAERAAQRLRAWVHNSLKRLEGPA